MRKEFLTKNPILPPKPINRVAVQSEGFVTITDESPEVNQGLHYDDFSVRSLLDSGAIDLLSGHPRLMSNDIEDLDLISRLDASPLVEDAALKKEPNKVESSKVE